MDSLCLFQDCEATDLRALNAGEKVKPHKVREAAKKGTFPSGPTTYREGEGGKGRTTKEKEHFWSFIKKDD